MSLNHKNVLLTGASGTIGNSIALFFAEKGFNVFASGRNSEKLQQLALSPGINGFFPVDLLSDNASEKLFFECKKSLGSIDILINNAGAYLCCEFEKTSYRDINNLLKLNVQIPYNLSKLCVPDMKNNNFGRIINIGSVSGVVGEAYAVLYSMTKSCFNGFSKALALETASYGITVNTVNPGWVDTNLLQTDNMTFEHNEIIETVPQKRFISPDEIASLCFYLASDHAKGITGQSLNICAGITMG